MLTFLLYSLLYIVIKKENNVIAWVHVGGLKGLLVHYKMKKLLIAIVCCFMLVSCHDVPQDPAKRRVSDMVPTDYEKELVMDPSRFFVVRIPQVYYELRTTKVIVDSETRVQYLMLPGVTSHTLTVLVDSTGAPLLYKGELPKKK